MHEYGKEKKPPGVLQDLTLHMLEPVQAKYPRVGDFGNFEEVY